LLNKYALNIPADISKLEEVLLWLKKDMSSFGVSEKGQFNMIMAAEEIFSNIVSYAYAQKENATVEIITEKCDDMYTATFIDSGKKFNPIEQKNPDITGKLSDRQIGGLGVFLAKKVSDMMTYKYEDGHNILKIGIYIKNPSQ